MAFSFNNGGVGRRRFRGTETLSEMNVVPLVDVVLVLLIIFMLTAHAMEFGLEVEVPKVRQQPEKSVQDLPVITIDREGNFFLNEQKANINTLAEDIRKRFGKETNAVYVRADKGTVWDPIANVVSELNAAKFAVRMVTQAADDESPGPRGARRK